MRSIQIATLVALLGAASSSAAAQQTLVNIVGVGGGAHLGWAVSGVGDINKDGFPDLIVGAPDYLVDAAEDVGLARVYSGKDLTVLWQETGIGPGDRYGQFVTEAGDVNQDGWPDFIVSALHANGPGDEPIATGSAEIRSGQDFTILYRWYGDATLDDFGDCASPVGDVNNDGWPDVVVGARRHDGPANSSGIARVFSGFDGSVLYNFTGSGENWLTGSSADGAGDVNADGYADIIVGSRGASPDGLNKAGQAIVYSGFDGSILLQVDGRFAGDGLGSGVAGVGDIDKDGFDDVAIGTWMSDQLGPTTGSAMVMSGATGEQLYEWIGEMEGSVLGVWVDGPGDVNRDGWPDIVCGANAADCLTMSPIAYTSGKSYVWSGRDGSLLFDACGDGGGDGLGVVVADPGDVNQDGYADVMSGAYWNDAGGHDSGFARVWSGCPNVLALAGAALPGSNGELHLAGCGELEGNDPITLRLINAKPLAHTMLIMGLQTVFAPFHGGFMVPSPDFLIFGLGTNAQGSLDLDATWPPGIPSGFQIAMQYWVPDPGGTNGWSSSNGLLAITH